MSAGDFLGVDPSAGSDGEPPDGVDVGSGPWVKVLVVVTLVVLVGLVVVAVLAVTDDDTGPAAVVIKEAVDTRVLLACRIPVPASDGLRMPESTVVLTGPDGRLTADDVEMGPGRLAVVVDGELRVLPPGTRLRNPCNTSGID